MWGCVCGVQVYMGNDSLLYSNSMTNTPLYTTAIHHRNTPPQYTTAIHHHYPNKSIPTNILGGAAFFENSPLPPKEKKLPSAFLGVSFPSLPNNRASDGKPATNCCSSSTRLMQRNTSSQHSCRWCGVVCGVWCVLFFADVHARYSVKCTTDFYTIIIYTQCFDSHTML